jgi:hypothetical protein
VDSDEQKVARALVGRPVDRVMMIGALCAQTGLSEARVKIVLRDWRLLITPSGGLIMNADVIKRARRALRPRARFAGGAADCLLSLAPDLLSALFYFWQ